MGTVTVTNLSSSLTASNVFVPPPDTAPIIATSTCPAVLAPGQSCTISFSSAVQTATITVPIHGDNTNTVDVLVKVAAYAYVSLPGNGSGQTIDLCQVNPVDNTLSGCVDSGAGISFQGPTTILFNVAGTKAYVENTELTPPPTVCDVTASGLLTNCQNLGGFTFPSYTHYAFAFNPSQTLAYGVETPGDTITICQIINGLFQNCIDSGATFVSVSGMAFNLAGTRAYITDSNTVVYCDVNSSNGTLTNCATTGIPLSTPEGITINALGTIAYIANAGLNTVVKCAIDQTTGALNSCSNTGSGFNFPTKVTLLSQDSFAYVGNNVSGTVSLCQVSLLGELSGCTTTVSFSLPNTPGMVAFN